MTEYVMIIDGERARTEEQFAVRNPATEALLLTGKYFIVFCKCVSHQNPAGSLNRRPPREFHGDSYESAL